jgi:CelD/BcsL family acetyltransferase involved in cellulose biosynthesis
MLKIVREDAEFDGLAREWNELLRVSASDTPFLRHEYARTWWSTRGGGEWPHAQLCIVTRRAPDGRLLGVAPMFLMNSDNGEATLRLIGSIEISDYLDVIARESELPQLLKDVVAFLTSDEAPRWTVVALDNLLEDSPTLPLLRDVASRHGLVYREAPGEVCPYVALPRTWDEYMSGLEANRRKEFRRALRGVEDLSDDCRVRFTSAQSKLDEDMELLFALMAPCDDDDALVTAKETFLTGAMRAHMKAMARAANDAGWLQLAFLEIHGEVAAADLAFCYGNRLWAYNGAISSQFREYAPGKVLTLHLMRRAIESGLERFDFLRGNEAYKYLYGAVDRRIVHATLSR